MANPRKFSEKIALHNQKQAEETAAFEQIMREVGSATRNIYQKDHLHINPALPYRGGSLPNVNQIGNNTVDLQAALMSLEDIKQGREIMERDSPSRHMNARRSRPFDKRFFGQVDSSPYGSAYLSPPPDTSWRRTNSDSAINQSLMNQSDYHSSNTPSTGRRVPDDGTFAADGMFKGYWENKKDSMLSPLVHSRPKSCEVPGINIYHSEQDPGVIHIPISNNTGSLPDLSNLQFPPPLTTPLDVEDQTTPPYSTGLTIESQNVGVADPYKQHTQYSLYHSQQPSQNLPSNQIRGYRSGSPAETSGSAPQSPVSQSFSLSSSPKNLFDQNYYIPASVQSVTANSVQQRFEEFNLIDSVPVSSLSPVFISSGVHYSQAQSSAQDLLDQSAYYATTSANQMVSYSQNVQSPVLSGHQQQTTPQTPQTPNSIPDIVLTDFSTCSGASDAISRQEFVKDISSAMAGMAGAFDSDLFPSDEALKVGLDPIDLQMLTDPDLVADPATEDSFRLDRL